MQHWEDTSFLWCRCDLLWGIRVSWILTKYFGILFRHPDFLVVFPFVGGWFRMLQQSFQARCMLLPIMHKQILEPQPHSSTSHQMNNLHVQRILSPPPRSYPGSIGFLPSILCGCLPLRWRLVLGVTVVVPGKQMYKHAACFYPVHQQIFEPHPRSSTSHQINFTSIVFWPPRPVGAGGAIF